MLTFSSIAENEGNIWFAWWIKVSAANSIVGLRLLSHTQLGRMRDAFPFDKFLVQGLDAIILQQVPTDVLVRRIRIVPGVGVRFLLFGAADLDSDRTKLFQLLFLDSLFPWLSRSIDYTRKSATYPELRNPQKPCTPVSRLPNLSFL